MVYLRQIYLDFSTLYRPESPEKALVVVTARLLFLLQTPIFSRWLSLGTIAKQSELQLKRKDIGFTIQPVDTYLGGIDEIEKTVFLQAPLAFSQTTLPFTDKKRMPEAILVARLIQLVFALFSIAHLQAHRKQEDDARVLTLAATRYGLQQQLQFLSVLYELFSDDVFLAIADSAREKILDLV